MRKVEIVLYYSRKSGIVLSHLMFVYMYVGFYCYFCTVEYNLHLYVCPLNILNISALYFLWISIITVTSCNQNSQSLFLIQDPGSFSSIAMFGSHPASADLCMLAQVLPGHLRLHLFTSSQCAPCWSGPACTHLHIKNNNNITPCQFSGQKSLWLVR